MNLTGGHLTCPLHDEKHNKKKDLQYTSNISGLTASLLDGNY